MKVLQCKKVNQMNNFIMPSCGSGFMDKAYYTCPSPTKKAKSMDSLPQLV